MGVAPRGDSQSNAYMYYMTLLLNTTEVPHGVLVVLV